MGVSLDDRMGLSLDDLKLIERLKLIFLNIRSILANHSLFQLDFELSPITVIGLTETFIQNLST